MKTLRLSAAVLLALALVALTTALLAAAPIDPGKELRTELGNAPILPGQRLTAHSEAWDNFYFDRHVNTRIVSAETDHLAPGLRRGGLARDTQVQARGIATDLRPMKLKNYYV